ncbi:MAG: hypothetical protein JNL57_06415 [Bacteroidetes bacterium]|nr:hypothetical protein [Bacteroidota bacterium]
MFKTAGLLLIFFLSATSAAAQYSDDADTSRIDTSGLANGPSFSLKDKLEFGTELMITGGSGVFFGELSPFTGVFLADPVFVGAGVHGSVLAPTGGQKAYGYYGAHAFGRVIFGQQFFLHAEYRLLNGVVPSSGVNRTRQWVSSPIFGLGYTYGSRMGSWLLVGYAPNTNFQEINPMGNLVYRIGFTF